MSKPTQSELLRDERSRQLRLQLHAVVSANRRNRMEMASLFYLLKEQGYWREWGYPDFRSCIRQEFGLSPSTTRQLIKVYHVLVERLHLPLERVQHLEWSKVVLVTQVLTVENVDAVLNDVEKFSFQELKRKYQPEKIHTKLLPLVAETIVSMDSAEFPPAEFRQPKPPEDQFFTPDEVWEQLCYALAYGQSALLKGHSGCGKTELCGLVAEAFDRKVVRFNCGAMSEPRSTLIGNTHLDRDKGTWFQPSRFVAAVQTPGCCILLDELSRAPRDAFNILLPLLDGQRYLALDESADATRVPVAPGVTFLATANLGAAYTGADQLDWALFDRFPVVVEMDFPPPDKESAILTKKCPGLSNPDARLLVRFAVRQRELAREGEFTAQISTRSLLAAARQVSARVTMANAIRFTILHRFAEDGGDISDRTRLRQLLQKLMD